MSLKPENLADSPCMGGGVLGQAWCCNFLLGSDASKSHDLAPLLNFPSNERGKLDARSWKNHRSQVSKACLDRFITKASIDLTAKPSNNFIRCVLWSNEAEP